MNRFFVVFAILAFISCSQPVMEVDTYNLATDPRLTMVDAASTKWLRHPYGKGIADDDPIAEHCNEPGWSYIFYDDLAVIGYEPLPDNTTVMHDAVRLTVELHNRDNPLAEWDYINVAPIQPPPPVTSNDPVLGHWQVALVLDDGTIVQFYQAVYDWEWNMWKSSSMALTLELYNRDNDPDAHLVWGTNE